MDVEKELFILDGIARVSDDARTENLFFTEGDDDERAHVPSCAAH